MEVSVSAVVTDLEEAPALEVDAVADVALVAVGAHIMERLPHRCISPLLNAMSSSPDSTHSKEKPPGSNPGSNRCKTMKEPAETNNEDCHQCPERIT